MIKPKVRCGGCAYWKPLERYISKGWCRIQLPAWVDEDGDGSPPIRKERSAENCECYLSKARRK